MKIRKLTGALMCLSLFGMVTGLVACGSGTTESSEVANTIAQPTNFTFDKATGEWSFDGVENAGYYFVKMYAYNEETKTESNQYLSSSERISGGTGKKSGTLDVSAVAWGTYHVNAYAYAASGLGLKSPDPVTISISDGGKLSTPALRFVTEGTTVKEMMVDGYSLANYAGNELLTSYEFTIYGSDGTSVIKTFDQSSNDFEIDSTNLTKGYLFKSHQLADFTLDAGSYYAQVVAKGQGTLITDSDPSEKVAFTLTADGAATTVHSERSGDGSTYMEGEFFSLVSPNVNKGDYTDLLISFDSSKDTSFTLGLYNSANMGSSSVTSYYLLTYDTIKYNDDGSFVADGWALSFITCKVTAAADGTFTVSGEGGIFNDTSNMKTSGTWTKEGTVYTLTADGYAEGKEAAENPSQGGGQQPGGDQQQPGGDQQQPGGDQTGGEESTPDAPAA